MRVCVVNQHAIAAAFRTLGHEVLDLRPGPGPKRLPALLAENAFEPDLVLEVEHLGPRTMLCGMHEVACPTLFWAVDVHLNAWWHRYYGRQFDGVLCSQLPWVERLRTMGLPRVAYMPWFGSKRPFVPWTERDKPMCLVGRVTAHRPVRKRMVEHLQENYGLVHLDGLHTAAMQDAYDTARLVPNESIYAEVNFRLFEAASSGCLVLNQEVEGGVGHLFEPGREVLEFSDIVQLDALAARFGEEPELAESIARAGWERVGREHMPEHRAAAVLRHAEDWGAATERGPVQDAMMWLAIHRQVENGMFEVPLGQAMESWRRFVESSPMFFVAALRALWWQKERDEALQLLRQEVETGRFYESYEVNFTASGLAIRLDDPALARTFWLRHIKSVGRESAGLPDGVVALLLAWSKECERFWQEFRPGCRFDKDRTVPDSALECLLLANELDPGNADCTRRMNALAARQPGAMDFRMSVLSLLTMREPDNWRLGLDLGLVNLRAMRLREGIEELVLAREAAVRQGAAGRFDRVLASRDSAGAVAAVLARYGI